MEREHNLAVFIDFENLALGFDGTRSTALGRSGSGRRVKLPFDIAKVLERLVEKGKIIVKKAYADWEAYAAYKRPFHEAGIELIEIPKRTMTGKNSADIRLVVDAMDLCYSKEHIDIFVIVSGDSDFSPLVSKLKENGKHVIGLGMKGSSSELLISNCDEFIFYEELDRPQSKQIGLITKSLPKQKRQVFQLLVEAVAALHRENKEVLWSSMVKQTMQRKRPSFSETHYGYEAFGDLLKDAEEHHIIKLRKDPKSGTLIVEGIGKD